jgi:hypothetical protein
MAREETAEDKRAIRIAIRINQNHYLLATIYENLVDRDFVSAQKDIKMLITDIRLILKSMPEDDF